MLEPLPTEVWLSVFDHLQRRDLVQVAAVSRHWRAMAKPLFYRHGTFSRAGLQFPHADHPLPFTDFPEFRHTPLPAAERGLISANLRRLEVRAHDWRDCEMFRRLSKERLKLKVDVLWFELVRWKEEEYVYGSSRLPMFPASTCHIRYNFDQPMTLEESLATNALSVNKDHIMRCGYIDCGDLWRCEARKIVFRNAQMHHHRGRDYPVPAVRWASDYVLVIDSATLWNPVPRDRICNSGWSFSPIPKLGNTITSLTIIFWTGDPEAKWITPCGCYTDAYYQTREHWHPCRSKWAPWHDLGQTLYKVRNVRRITVVNVDGIMEQPPQPPPRTGELADLELALVRPNSVDNTRNVVEGTPREIVEQVFARASRLYEFAWKRPKFEVITMDQWLERDEWDDVFSREEMRPFLGAKSFAP